MLVDHEALEPGGGAWERTCKGPTTPGQAAELAKARFPDKQVSTLYFLPGEPIHVFLRGAGDLNAIEGDGLVWVHPTCEGLAKAVDLGEGRLAEQAQNMMFSLHGGYSFGPVLGPLLVVATGLSLVFFSISGVIVFFTRTWRRKKSDEREYSEAVPAAE
jgi:uncharacterized iron-regulated membrane protein